MIYHTRADQGDGGCMFVLFVALACHIQMRLSLIPFLFLYGKSIVYDYYLRLQWYLFTCLNGSLPICRTDLISMKLCVLRQNCIQLIMYHNVC
jgi:hypothetical protein